MFRRVRFCGALIVGGCLASVGACGDSKKADSSACEQGSEACDCYGNNTCDSGLVCRSDLCVDLDGSAAGNGGQSSAGAHSETAGDGSNSVASGGSTASGTAGSANTAAGGRSNSGGTANSGGSSAGGANAQTGGNGSTTTAPAGSPVALHGQLTVEGTQIVDEHGATVQLKGVSSMWLNWDPVGYAESKQGMQWMRDNWGMTVFRAAMGAALPEGVTGTDDTYTGNPARAEAQVRTIVENAIELGLYVIIDWHDHEAETRQAAAQSFFEAMARDYGALPNVLYEVYNEPLDVSWTSTLKPYHAALTTSIRAEDSDNIIILGTPNWSQDVDIAALSPVTGTNLMYTLHFYACSHGAALRAKAQDAYADGLPIFVTEWGAADADGGVDGVVCEAEATTWHNWLDARSIGWTAWKLDGCTDSTCLFKGQDVSPNGNWTSADLNGHAEFVISRMQETVTVPLDDCTPTGTCAAGDGQDCVDGALVARDCSGCALIAACGVDCCDGIGWFGADTYPDFVLRNELITSFTQSSSQAGIEASFTAADQVGALTFALDAPQAMDRYAVEFDMTAVGDGTLSGAATASLEDGESGCLYALGEYSTDQYWLESQITCWGTFDDNSPVRQINVRIDSTSSGNGTLVVREVRF